MLALPSELSAPPSDILAPPRNLLRVTPTVTSKRAAPWKLAAAPSELASNDTLASLPCTPTTSATTPAVRTRLATGEPKEAYSASAATVVGPHCASAFTCDDARATYIVKGAGNCAAGFEAELRPAQPEKIWRLRPYTDPYSLSETGTGRNPAGTAKRFPTQAAAPTRLHCISLSLRPSPSL
jgi:hypothetical protein